MAHLIDNTSALSCLLVKKPMSCENAATEVLK